MNTKTDESHILLVGNGINICKKSNDTPIKWSEILNEAQTSLIPIFLEEKNKIDAKNTSISSTLLFESLCNKNTEQTVRESVRKTIEQSTNDIYDFGVWDIYDTILTTNFDDNLIKTAPKGKSRNEPKIINKDKYLSRRFDLPLSKKIFYIHGFYKIPESICLGFDHYITNLTKIQSFVKSNYPNPKSKKFISQKEGKRKSISWVDYFFAENTSIDIVGLNLCSEEIDLWWLLKHRSKYSSLLKNNIIRYYDLDTSLKDDVQKSIRDKKIILNSMNVEVVPITHSETCKAYDKFFYEQCFKKIKNFYKKEEIK